ncbi:MAG: hypothetical protein LBS75_05960 [Synergistaceae bacterium]|jgi:hypothetical protein|nr:hypothetical protein [Synergistaceae bacterium]
MGITTKSVLQAILHAAKQGVDFKNTLMIGRQSCFFNVLDEGLRAYDPTYALEKSQNMKTDIENTRLADSIYSEPLFKYLGAETVDSVDYSDYEKATIMHDMNIPIHKSLKNSFSFVFDGGALEHVFNYPIAVKNCMDMVKINGHLMLWTPANNLFGHGFYQFSPELFYSLLTEVNGYSNTSVFIHDKKLKWYRIIEPQKAKGRVSLWFNTKKEMCLAVISEKIAEVPELLNVMQSDYADILWRGEERRGEERRGEERRGEERRGVRALYRKLPKSLRNWLTPKLWPIVERHRMRKFYEHMSDF